MANKLTQAKIDAMWAAWQEKQTLDYVAKKVGVSWQAVKRYREKENWDARMGAIERRAEHKADMVLSDRRARDLKLIEAAKRVWASQLTGKLKVVCPACAHEHSVDVPKMKAGFRDLPEFIRICELLSGEADSREEIVIKVERL
jgi:hypothetical protein